MKRALLLVCYGSLLSTCSGSPRFMVAAHVPKTIDSLRLVGEFNIPPLRRALPQQGFPFGGISGLALLPDGTELLGVSDDSKAPRVYRLQLQARSPLTVNVVAAIDLTTDARAPVRLDPEGIAVLQDGHLLIASEGYGNTEPRVPPAIVEYTATGEFVRQLQVRERYLPSATGQLTRGVRGNAAFESLTIAPGEHRLFTATESPLVQDGDVATFEHGAPVRILEYVRRHDTYEPGREFVYVLEPIVREPYSPAASINGLVELIATSDTNLLALERSYVANAERTEQGTNRVRVFRVSLTEASDVSKIDSLAHAGATPVRKQLVLDLSGVTGLSPELDRLENFEAMTFGPPLPDGRASLILASDDNFNATQRTSFLLFAVDR